MLIFPDDIFTLCAVLQWCFHHGGERKKNRKKKKKPAANLPYCACLSIMVLSCLNRVKIRDLCLKAKKLLVQQIDELNIMLKGAMYTFCRYESECSCRNKQQRQVFYICIMEETVAVTALQFKEAAEETKTCKTQSSISELCSQFLIYLCLLIIC